MISNVCQLCIPLPEDKYSIVTDASGLSIGGVLQVRRDDRWEAAAFFSRQLKGAEQRYSATEMEALAVVESINHFAYYLYGHQFDVYTDHRPLVHLLDSEKLNPRLRRLGYKLQGWMVNIQYLPGTENGFADALSREERSRTKEEEKKNENREETPGCRLVRGDVEGAPPLKDRRSGGPRPPH